MKKLKSSDSKTPLQFKIVGIIKQSYFQNDHKSFGLSDSDIAKGTVTLSSRFDSDVDPGFFVVFVKVTFHAKKQESSFDLFGIETIHRFQIKGIKKKITTALGDSFQIPDELLLTFLNISISGTRGMLVGLNSNPAYSSIILPIISPRQLLDNSKGKENAK